MVFEFLENVLRDTLSPQWGEGWSYEAANQILFLAPTFAISFP
jgi:hypothetical protein